LVAWLLGCLVLLGAGMAAAAANLANVPEDLAQDIINVMQDLANDKAFADNSVSLWVRVRHVATSWIGLDWIGLDWIGLDWIGLDWIGLDWIGLDWIGLIG
jgi:hypothetical protein